MSPSRSGAGRDRLLALAGPAYALLMVAGAAAFPSPPGGDVVPASDPGWLGSHVSAVIAQSYVRALAAVAFVAFAAAVAGACRRALATPSPLPGLALAGGALTGGLLLLGQAVSLAAALTVHDSSPGVIRALGAVQNGFLDMSSMPALLLFAAAGLTALRTGLFPRWLSALTLLGVPLALADAASYDGGPLESLGLVGLVYFLAWSLVAGVRLALQPAAPVEAAAQPGDRRPPATMSFS